jgi:hypothetical protein
MSGLWLPLKLFSETARIEGIEDVVYVIPQHFDLQYTRQIAQELEEANHRLLAQQRPYLLIVFGRLGTLDPLARHTGRMGSDQRRESDRRSCPRKRPS